MVSLGLHRETADLLKSLTPDDLVGKGLTVKGHPVARWKLLRSMIEHEVHHHGDIASIWPCLVSRVPRCTA